MSQLPLLKDLDQMQTKWKAQLDPILAAAILQGNYLSNIKLSVGENQINHLLQRLPQGWIITDIQGGASIYRSQLFSVNYLYLTSDAAVTLNLLVY